MLMVLEMETNVYEATYYTLSDYYASTGFRSEQVEDELSAKTKEELLEMYYDL